MTKIPHIFWLFILFSSCSRRIISDKDIVRNEPSLSAAAAVLLQQTDTVPHGSLKVDYRKLNSATVKKAIKKFGFYEVEIYKSYKAEPYGSCIEPCDSVIIFSRCGNPFFGYCEEVIFDYSTRKNSYTKLSKTKGKEFYKVTGNIYYKRYRSPIM
jgi:hypothetical protein